MPTATKTITLAHGAGGRAMHDLILSVFKHNFADIHSSDAAIINATANKLAFTTDSFVVDPLFFPGGDIGRVAICGTVNDLATSGCVPQYLSCAFIIEEGFSVADLDIICQSMRDAAAEAGVTIVTGDTKVIEKHTGVEHKPSLFINTTGVGSDPKLSSSTKKAKLGSDPTQPQTNIVTGDKIILSGTIADHGMAVLAERMNLFRDKSRITVQSDCAPLNLLVKALLEAAPQTRILRDPTRGGLASCLNEILAGIAGVNFVINEEDIPINQPVAGLCQMLGFDPLQVANEGKIVAIVPANSASSALSALKSTKYGKDAAIIGEVQPQERREEHRTTEPSLAKLRAGSCTLEPGKVVLQTSIGTRRAVHWPESVQLPRIC